MSLPWARALSERGVVAARDLRQRSFSQASALFADAKRRGDIASVPTADALVAMMLDSARIRLSAPLNATVEGPGHRPLAGARVLCGSVEGTTDTHGRVRLLRLPLGQRVEVGIEKAGYAKLTATLASLHGVQVVEGHHFLLKRSRSRSSSRSRKIARVLSEFSGDLLPTPSGERIHAIEVKNQPLRIGDVMCFFERLQGGDVKLVSHFKELRDGRLIAPIWRLSSNSLPAGALPGQKFQVTRKGLKPIQTSPHKLARWRVARQVTAELRQLGKPKTRAQAHRRLEKGLKLFLERTRTLRTI